ncbi:MAG: tRNA (adenosine(37)-N6)-threonylcarbamoyltransferase complex ATPase subunit type 1 TsaE [Muribaculaceae bacterium]
MTTTEIHVASLADIDAAAQKFLELMGDETVYAFHGEMGVGKTTFISALARALGVDAEEANSPSFAIVNEYRSETTAELIYHFDLYRLETMEEILDIGFEDYLDCGALCLIEWPEKVEDILPNDTVDVTIRLNDDHSRTIIVAQP